MSITTLLAIFFIGSIHMAQPRQEGAEQNQPAAH